MHLMEQFERASEAVREARRNYESAEHNMAIARAALTRAERELEPLWRDLVNAPAPAPLSVDQRSAPAVCSPAIDRDNFDQILSDVLADMNADDEAAAAATKEDDSF